MSKILIGTDPEFFLYDTKKDMYVSAHEMIPGNKKEPHKVDCGAIQVDGTAVEFNIDPVDNANDFEHNVATVLSQLRSMIPERYEFRYEPIVTYNKAYFNSLPDSVKELGCDPDYSGHTLQLNVIPKSIGTRRTGSGHIHIGWTKSANTEAGSEHFKDAAALASQMDRLFNFIEPCWDKKNYDRKAYYGGNAAFRAKPYGCEYRGLSNAWLSQRPLWKKIFNFSSEVYTKTLNGTVLPGYLFYEGYDAYSVNRDLAYLGFNTRV